MNDGKGVRDEAREVAAAHQQELLGCGRISYFTLSETGGHWRVLSRGVTKSYLCNIVG